MELFSLEGLHLALRWFHVVAVITWIGHAYFFNWLDRGLRPVNAIRDGESVEGELWMVHSGGFYRVEKLDVAPTRMPDELHWFRWEAAFSWLSGFALLLVTYYFSGAALMLDSSVSELTAWEARGLGLGVLVVGWFAYDTLWATDFARSKLAPVVGIGALIALAWGLSHWLSGRAAYIHVGSLMGTIMVANVWRRIIPAQNALLASTKTGGTPDPALGKAAKARSIHNNYLSLPVVFVMISNHFWWTFGHRKAWLVLACALLGGVALRHLMNRRLSKQSAQPAVVGLVLAALFGAAWTLAPDAPGDTRSDDGPAALGAPVREAHELGGNAAARANDVPAGNAAAGASDASGGNVAAAENPAPGAGDAADAGLVTPSAESTRARGVLTGVVRLDGEPAARPVPNMSGDCAGLPGSDAHIDTVSLSGNLLANAVVWLESEALSAERWPLPASIPELDQRGCSYVPRVLGLRTKQTLRVLNSDPTLHNVHFMPDQNKRSNAGMPMGVQPLERSFRRAETMIRVKCDVHPWMGAWIGVFDHPWFAVSDAQGRFAWDDVPAGEYRLHAWHEVFGEISHSQTVRVGENPEVRLRFSAD
ncbi:MAG: hypothetical protein DHS20C15_31590 [Planctomycetota bacterium]|nr:MAG: hypothetical protein DHS20C15_31590 [Planctomycetota bacterium]